MVDRLTPGQRSWNMSRIRSTNTKPEKIVRSILHSMGYRFRLHRRELPGEPDVVLPRYKTVIFIHGCFWHRHQGCKYKTTPKTNSEFWKQKFMSNVKRDQKNQRRLRETGWNVIALWQCELRDVRNTALKLSKALKSVSGRGSRTNLSLT